MWRKLQSPAGKIYLVALLLVAVLYSCTSCTSLYPVGGAIIGGAAGSTLGPAGAAVGAGAGSSAGIALQKNSELKKAHKEIKALTTGDVDTLVKLKLEEAKSGGFFDSILEGVYSLIKIVGVGLALFFIIPILYTRFIHKEVRKQGVQITNGGPKKT